MQQLPPVATFKKEETEVAPPPPGEVPQETPAGNGDGGIVLGPKQKLVKVGKFEYIFQSHFLCLFPKCFLKP